MAKVDFRFNLPGLNELMKSAEMQGVLNEAANQIAATAGEGYEVESAHNINFIAIAAVHAETYEAKRDNSQNNTLLKAAKAVLNGE